MSSKLSVDHHSSPAIGHATNSHHRPNSQQSSRSNPLNFILLAFLSFPLLPLEPFPLEPLLSKCQIYNSLTFSVLRAIETDMSCLTASKASDLANVCGASCYSVFPASLLPASAFYRIDEFGIKEWCSTFPSRELTLFPLPVVSNR